MNTLTMKSFMDEISKELKEKYTVRKFAAISGVSRERITRAIECKNEMKFESFLNLIDALYRSAEIRREKINTFILLLKGPLNIRKALCYAHVSGEHEVIDALIRKHNNNESVNQFIPVYDLFNKRNKNELKGQQIVDEIRKNKISSNAECQALLNLLYMVAMYEVDDSNAVAPYGKEAARFISKIDQKYIKDCLHMLYKERTAYMYLLADKLEMCRKTCNSILKSTMDVPMIKAVARGCLGESYIYENPIIAETHIESALNLLEKINVPRKSQKYFAFKTTLAHLYIENNFNIQNIDFNYIHEGEEAHFECLYRDREKGITMYKELERKGFSAHQLYSYSKVIGDIEGLKKALIHFERSGNLFYAKGVKKVLMKSEVNLIE